MKHSTWRTSRKRRYCDHRIAGDAHCDLIEPGDRYRLTVYSPGHDGITPDCWMAYPVCAGCGSLSEQYEQRERERTGR